MKTMVHELIDEWKNLYYRAQDDHIKHEIIEER